MARALRRNLAEQLNRCVRAQSRLQGAASQIATADPQQRNFTMHAMVALAEATIQLRHALQVPDPPAIELP